MLFSSSYSSPRGFPWDIEVHIMAYVQVDFTVCVNVCVCLYLLMLWGVVVFPVPHNFLTVRYCKGLVLLLYK